MKKIKIYLLILFFSSKLFSQNSKAEYGLYNIGLGGFVGGIGSLINKPKEQKPLHAFANGFWKGSIGGGMIHLSKVSAGEIAIKDNYSYSWLAKLNNSLGTSFVENATLNKPLLSKFHLNLFGFNRVEFSNQDKFKVRYKIMPVAFLLNSYVVATSKFEFKKTITTGELVFSSDKVATSLNYRGYTLGTTIVMKANYLNNKNTFSHELIHVYQYYDYNFINSFLDKPLNKFKSNSGFLSKYDFIYFDLQAPVLQTIYAIEKNKNKYYDNFFEKEAGLYSNTIQDY